MNHTWQYSLGFEPPSPIVEAELSLPWRDAAVVSHSFQIDSGSDLTGIPLDVLHSIGAQAGGIKTALDFNGRLAKIPFFEVSITIAGRHFEVVNVIGVRSRRGFVGRDVINHFVVTLDGLAGESSLSDQPRSR